jgi:hypothetical protein
LWLVTGDGLFQFLRFSVDTSAQMTALPTAFQYSEPEGNNPATSLAVRAASFSPAIERVVNSSGEQAGFHGLDFESGQLLTATATELPSDDLRKKWIAEHGVDLWASNKGGDKWQLGGLQTKLASVPEERWESASLNELRRTLAEVVMEEQEGLHFLSIRSDGGKPLTFAFQTGRGAIGLLQIAGFSDNPRGVKIRYKLLQAGSGGGGVTPEQQAFMRRYGLETTAPAGVPAPAAPIQAVKEKPALLAQAAPGEYRVKLTNGLEFEVVAIASSPRSGMVWWRPNGTLLAEPVGDRLGDSPKLCPGGKANVEFAVMIKNTGRSLTEREWMLAFDPQPQYVAPAELYKNNALTGEVSVIGFRSAPESLACKIGLADGAWQRMATWDGAGTLLNNESGGPLQLVRSSADDETCLRLQHKIDPNQFNLRIVARLKNGNHKVARVCRVEYGGTQEARVCALIQGLQTSNVVAYELYQVPLRWAVIPGIATKPTVPPIQGDAAAFGPVIERTIVGGGDANKRFIDFDAGKQFAAAQFFGPKDEPSPEETQKWWKQNGIDAMGDTSPATRGLVGFELVAVPVPPQEWDMAPARLDYYLAAAKPGTPATMSAKGDLPATFVIQTREGGRGLLQITGFTDNPLGVKIHYKLVQKSSRG